MHLMRVPATALVFTMVCGSVMANTSLVYDAEPNDTPQQAVTISLPDGSAVLRIMGAFPTR